MTIRLSRSLAHKQTNGQLRSGRVGHQVRGHKATRFRLQQSDSIKILNKKIMEVQLKPEYRMIHELHGRVGNWIYRTRKYANGETKIFANYSPKKNGDPDPKWGKLFV